MNHIYDNNFFYFMSIPRKRDYFFSTTNTISNWSRKKKCNPLPSKYINYKMICFSLFSLNTRYYCSQILFDFIYSMDLILDYTAYRLFLHQLFLLVMEARLDQEQFILRALFCKHFTPFLLVSWAALMMLIFSLEQLIYLESFQEWQIQLLMEQL